jgi:hypothetical protein
LNVGVRKNIRRSFESTSKLKKVLEVELKVAVLQVCRPL